MTMVNVFEAKSQLSKLIEKAAAGEDVIIARSGKPVARITRLVDAKPAVTFGILRGRVSLGDDFDEPLPDDEIAAFGGG
jgi:prevent-host-death family protein